MIARLTPQRSMLAPVKDFVIARETHANSGTKKQVSRTPEIKGQMCSEVVPMTHSTGPKRLTYSTDCNARMRLHARP